MDRFTWAVVAGVVGICVVALGSVLIPRVAERPPDLSSPDGVALAYALAIQKQDPDQAWALLASPEAAGPYVGPGFPPPVLVPQPPPATVGQPPPAPTAVPKAGPPAATQEQFRQAIYNVNPQRQGPGRRLRITSTTTSGERARVQMEVSFLQRGWSPFNLNFLFGGGGGPPSQTVNFELQLQGKSWRITLAPSPFIFL